MISVDTRLNYFIIFKFVQTNLFCMLTANVRLSDILHFTQTTEIIFN